MQAIEFETTAHQHRINIPESVPDGVPLRVLLLIADIKTAPTLDVKKLLAMLAEGLTDEDLARPRDLGREPVQWDI